MRFLGGDDAHLITLDDATLHRQLVCRARQCLNSLIFANTSDFKHDSARTHNGYPILRVAFAAAHTRLRWLLRHRLIWENADPNLPTAAHVVRNRTARCLDLAARD